MRKFIIMTLLLLSMLIPFTAAANDFSSSVRSALSTLFGTGYVPACAQNIVESMDKQLLVLLGEQYSRKDLRIVLTVPVSVNDFDKSNALARQVAEEISNELKTKGYRVLEIRRGKSIKITPKEGEFLLSRHKSKLLNAPVSAELIMTGTYTVTDKSVRYNCRLLHAGSHEIIASGNGTVPIYAEIYPLLEENPKDAQSNLLPSVKTKL